jgi:hypothetical protein
MRTIPQYIDPPLPERQRQLPGGLQIGVDNDRIRQLAISVRHELEEEQDFPGFFVGSIEDCHGGILTRFVIKADKTLEAIQKIEEDVGSHNWLCEEEDHFLGLSKQMGLTSNVIRLSRIRKENFLD